MLLIVLFIAGFVRLLIQGLCLSLVWNKFIPTMLHHSPIVFVQAVGLMLLYELISMDIGVFTMLKSSEGRVSDLAKAIYVQGLKIVGSIAILLLASFFELYL